MTEIQARRYAEDARKLLCRTFDDGSTCSIIGSRLCDLAPSREIPLRTLYQLRRSFLSSVRLLLPLSSVPMPIRRLSQSLINKIAAGEVIERPASVVKELMENAVDAGATRIDVAVAERRAGAGPRGRQRLRHPGRGIAAGRGQPRHQQAGRGRRPVPRRHAGLSRRGPGLDRRGQPAGAPQPHGATARAARRSKSPAGMRGEVAPCGCPVGTTVEVHNLFFNTPVRRKFLRTPQTELGHVSEAFTRIALALPQVHFTLRHNERQVFDLPATEDSARADRRVLRPRTGRAT